MRTADFHYDLPPELIAQAPAVERDASRLLVLHRHDRRVEHRRFRDLREYLRAGDVLVLNDSRVIPARLRGEKIGSRGQIEVLLVEENGINDWWAMLRPGKRVRPGTRLQFAADRPIRAAAHASPQEATPIHRGTATRPALTATVIEKNPDGHCRLRFEGVKQLKDCLDELGEVPLPPYIERHGPPPAEDRARYQTVFAQPPGSVAAPTAGLHFTELLLAALRAQGVQICFVTLHVGLGTFAPVKAERAEDHVMHPESYELPEETARAVNTALRRGGRVIAVGTTTVRVLESEAQRQEVERSLASAGEPAIPSPAVAAPTIELRPSRGRTNIFLYPPSRFRVVDALLTNFHLPESTLLMLVSAFASPGATTGRDLVLSTYAEAVREGYRFFSYGDAMLIL